MDRKPHPIWQTVLTVLVTTWLVYPLVRVVHGDGLFDPRPPAAPRDAAALNWSVESDGQAVRLRPEVTGAYTLVRQAWSGGEYRLIVAVAGSAGGPPAVHVVPLAIGGAGPTPSPSPTPTPTPTPSPTPTPTPTPTPKPPAALWGIVVEESGQRTAAQAAIITGERARTAFAGGRWRVLDQDSEAPADMAPYVARAKGQRLPALYVVDEAGRVYYEGPLPDSEAALEHLVAKIRKGGAQ